MEIFSGSPDDFIMTPCVCKNEEDSLISIFDMNLKKQVNHWIEQTDDSIRLNDLNRISVKSVLDVMKCLYYLMILSDVLVDGFLE